MTEPQRIITEMAQPCHITLTKNAKGSGAYRWEISIHAATVAEAENQIAEVDAYLQQKYGSESVKE